MLRTEQVQPIVRPMPGPSIRGGHRRRIAKVDAQGFGEAIHPELELPGSVFLQEHEAIRQLPEPFDEGVEFGRWAAKLEVAPSLGHRDRIWSRPDSGFRATDRRSPDVSVPSASGGCTPSTLSRLMNAITLREAAEQARLCRMTTDVAVRPPALTEPGPTNPSPGAWSAGSASPRTAVNREQPWYLSATPA